MSCGDITLSDLESMQKNREISDHHILHCLLSMKNSLGGITERVYRFLMAIVPQNVWMVVCLKNHSEEQVWLKVRMI